MYIALSILIGLLMVINGMGYKVGNMGKVSSLQAATAMAFCGSIAFALIGHAEWQFVDWTIVLAGLIFGGTTCFGLRLLRIALQVGPLSSAWCAVSLNFVLVITYSTIALHEPLTFCGGCALFCTICAIVAASLGVPRPKNERSPRSPLRYFLLLIGILVFIGTLDTGLKFCSAQTMSNGKTMTENCGNLLIFFTYFFMFVISVVNLSAKRTWVINRYFLWSGLMLSFSGISAYFIKMAIIDKTPAILLFAASNATSILGTSLVSSLCAGEKRTKSWYFTVGFAILAILFNR